MTKRFFADNLTTEELKKAYRKLCKELHPDNGGNEDEFKRMQAEYAERTQGSEAEQRRKARARRNAEEAARKKAEQEAARKAAEEAAKKKAERKPTKTQRVKDDLLNRLKGEKFEFYKGGHSHEAIRWNNAEFVITSLGVDIYFKNKETCAKAIELAKKYTFFQTSKYRKCVCWVKALKDDALTEVLNALR